jgi:hypothetical protein
MYRVRAIALLVALLPASAMADVSDEQATRAVTATKEYVASKAALRANAAERVSADDTIAQRRLAEGYCKQFSACLASRMGASMREAWNRANFAVCLSSDIVVKEK